MSKCRYSNMAEAMTIFAQYPGIHGIDAQHDIIRVDIPAGDVNKTDIARLSELDWDIDEEYDGFYYYP